MNYVILLALIVGLLTRIVDDYYDKKLKIKVSLIVIFALIYGFLIAFIIKELPVVTPLALAVIAGLLIARKIDFYGHLIGLASFLVAIYFFNVSLSFDLFLFLLFLFFGILDEIASDRYGKGKKNINMFLLQRPFLEVTTFLVSIYTGIWEIWLTLLLYDIGMGYVPVYKLFRFNSKRII